jgi:O-succinylbenzoic acid--CoA ligase
VEPALTPWQERLAKPWITGIDPAVLWSRWKSRWEELRHGSEVLPWLAEDPVETLITLTVCVALQRPIQLLHPAWSSRQRAEAEEMGRAPVRPGAIGIATGGSGGGLKLCIHDWTTLEAAAQALPAFLNQSPHHAISMLPPSHVSGLMPALRAWFTGGTVTFFKPEALFDLTEADLAGRTVSLVPTQLKRLAMQHRLGAWCGAAAVLVGGGPVADALLGEARAARLPICLCYGMTETAAVVAAQHPEAFLAGESPRLTALPGVTFTTVPPDAQAESPGRIRIESPALCYGYWGGEPRTNPWWDTGDAGWVDAQGRLHLAGRIDGMIITGGEKVDPRRVEAVLLDHPQVHEVLVLGRDDAEWGQRVVAFYTGMAKPSELRVLLADRLPAYMMPKQMLAVPFLPLDERGKPDHSRINQLLSDFQP